MWMRSSQVVRASGCQCQSRQMNQYWITYIKRKNPKNFPLKINSVLFRFASIFFFSLHFAYFLFVFASDFFLVNKFFVSFSFHFDFSLHFAYFTFVFASDFWCSASMWNKWKHAFFSLNKIFASISIFASEAGRIKLTPAWGCRTGPPI